MKKVLHIIGARPQFIKTFVVIKALNKLKIKNYLLHTGQHYDKLMSDIFFKELKFKKPDFHIKLSKKNSRIKNISKMINEIARILKINNPNLIVVYGDTDSTLSAAITAKKMGFKLMHVESGMRSNEKEMPEEQNRIVTDKLSDYLITSSKIATQNLISESTNRKKIYEFGDVMYDSLVQNIKTTRKIKKSLTNKKFILFTLHRDANCKIQKIINLIKQIKSLQLKVIWPVHPKLNKIIKSIKKIIPKNLKLIRPLSYIDTLRMIKNSQFIITDSGGIQREAFFLKKKTFVLRDRTEWKELVNNNSVKLINNNIIKILSSKKFLKSKIKKKNVYGKGLASIKIANLIRKIV